MKTPKYIPMILEERGGEAIIYVVIVWVFVCPDELIIVVLWLRKRISDRTLL